MKPTCTLKPMRLTHLFMLATAVTTAQITFSASTDEKFLVCPPQENEGTTEFIQINIQSEQYQQAHNSGKWLGWVQIDLVANEYLLLSQLKSGDGELLSQWGLDRKTLRLTNVQGYWDPPERVRWQCRVVSKKEQDAAFKEYWSARGNQI